MVQKNPHKTQPRRGSLTLVCVDKRPSMYRTS